MIYDSWLYEMHSDLVLCFLPALSFKTFKTVLSEPYPVFNFGLLLLAFQIHLYFYLLSIKRACGGSICKHRRARPHCTICTVSATSTSKDASRIFFQDPGAIFGPGTN
jgi:hypothetical protein